MTEFLMLVIFVLQVWILWDQKLTRAAIERLVDALTEYNPHGSEEEE